MIDSQSMRQDPSSSIIQHCLVLLLLLGSSTLDYLADIQQLNTILLSYTSPPWVLFIISHGIQLSVKIIHSCLEVGLVCTSCIIIEIYSTIHEQELVVVGTLMIGF